MRLHATIVLAALLLAGCSAQPRIQAAFQGKGAPALSTGIQQFEEGRYPEATKSLNSALTEGLNSTADQARAHKYLAFIHCSSNRERQCRDEFRKALSVDPALELAPAEAGHPVWGPIFRSLKAGR